MESTVRTSSPERGDPPEATPRKWVRDLHRWVLLFGLALTAIALAYLQYLDFQVLRGDVLSYWTDSLNWRAPYHPFHVPAYPLTLALVRGATLGALPPAVVLYAVTIASFAVCLSLAYRLGAIPTDPHRFGMSRSGLRGAMAAGLFMLWPFAGIHVVVFPLADMFAMALLLLGLWLSLRDHPLAGGVVMGFALVAHKALWPFAGMLLVAQLVQVKTKASLAAVGLACLPLGLLWVLGAMHYDSPSWLLSSNLEVEIQSASAFPLFPGLAQSLAAGSLYQLTKGLTVLGIMLLAVVIFIRGLTLPREDRLKWQSLAIAGSVILLIALLNEHEIWASVRFSRLLALPLAWLFGPAIVDALVRFGRLAFSVAAAGVVALVASQFVFIYYMAEVYFD